MPKTQFIDPKEARKKGEITFGTIPVNQYGKKIQDEKNNFSNEDLIRIYRDMRIIREFETMLNLIKTTNEYNGVPYNHPGPAHLSIGQEAAAVGMAYHLGADDYIFGSHRSHGEILAKGLSAIQKLNDNELMEIMKNFFDGAILKVVDNGKHETVKDLAIDFLLYGTLAEIFARETGFNKGLSAIQKLNDNELMEIMKNFFEGAIFKVVDNGKHDTVKDLAIDFLLYGTLAEIFARETGFNKGLGGSMHAFFTPFGVYPNNAIVGGSGDISVGAALYKKVNLKKGIVVANIGDASMGCGPVWEGITFAAMDQFKKLWEGEYKGGLPIIFNFMNNQYGMGGQTCGETMGYDMLARVGAGVNPEMMHAERVDGYNPLAVIDAMKRKRKILEDKKGPVLLDTLTYRISGHSPSDASSYRTKEEIEAWQNACSVKDFAENIVKAGITDQNNIDKMNDNVVNLITNVTKLATNDEVSPPMNLDKDPEAISRYMFSNGSVDKFDDREPEMLLSIDENPRVQQIKKKERFGLDKNGKPYSKIKTYQLRDGLFEAIIDRFQKDPTLVAYGEENRDWGGAFAVYRGLTEGLPYNRLFNSTISEGAIAGTAAGYAMAGGRVIAEIMYCDFLGRSGDEVFNQLPKWQAMSGGVIKMPVVIRVSVGSKYGAQHSQDWSSLVAHIPGLKVVFPATPFDAKGLMNAALQGTDPVIFFESQRIYDIGELFHEEGVPEGYYEIPIGEPDVKRKGEDITILTVGSTLYNAVKAADTLKEQYGVSAEIIDARSLVPFDYDKVLASVKKTGKIILASDACSRNSYLKDIAETVTELAFDDLDAPPVVVGSKNWITPAHELEDEFFPQPDWIIDAIHEKILPLKGHDPVNNFTKNEQLRCSRKGL